MDKPSIGSVYPTTFRSNKNAERKWRTSQKLGLVIALVTSAFNSGCLHSRRARQGLDSAMVSETGIASMPVSRSGS